MNWGDILDNLGNHGRNQVPCHVSKNRNNISDFYTSIPISCKNAFIKNSEILTFF